MIDMKRLTDENDICTNCDGIAYCRDDCLNKQMYDKLKHYEDLEEQGKLVLHPTYAYCIIGNEVRKGFVFEVTYCICRKPLYAVRYNDNSLDKHTGYLGLSVFLTREEAEEALRELQNN